MYEYRAHVTDVYDGDTITVSIDLGFGVWLHKQKIRLRGLDTPEVRGPERIMGIRVRDRVRQMILCKDITLRTYKDKKGKYGRWIGVIITHDNINLNDWLIENGLAKKVNY